MARFGCERRASDQLERWRFSIGGLVAHPAEWTWQEFQQLQRVKVFADFIA